jgi:hypothetical protein
MPRGVPKMGWRAPAKAHFKTPKSGANYGKSKSVGVGSPTGSWPKRRK